MVKWSDAWTTSLIIPIPKKGDLTIIKCSNCRTTSLISNTSSILLRIKLNRLTPQAEEILADEQVGFRQNRSTTEHILNCRILMEKHMVNNDKSITISLILRKSLIYQISLYRVWHEGLWHMMSEFGIGNDLIEFIKSFYNSAKRSVLLNI